MTVIIDEQQRSPPDHRRVGQNLTLNDHVSLVTSAHLFSWGPFLEWWTHRWPWRTSSGPGRTSAPRWDIEWRIEPSTLSSSGLCQCYKGPGRRRTWRDRKHRKSVKTTAQLFIHVLSLQISHHGQLHTDNFIYLRFLNIVLMLIFDF